MKRALSMLLVFSFLLVFATSIGAQNVSVAYTGGLTGSDWAMAELGKANSMGLIPDSLNGQDLTKPITRAEFAAVSVKVYEVLSGTEAVPAANNPFNDTRDSEVLKALNVGITVGVSANQFSPGAILDREQAATMLTRVYKKVLLEGWTMQTDNQFTLRYSKPASFADDTHISSWAKDSVYFMAAYEIIRGMGGNAFAPKNLTSEQETAGYANATREQALLIAVRMIENAIKIYEDLTNNAFDDNNNNNNANVQSTNEANSTANPAEDAKSKAAIVGSWSHISINRLTAWAFNENGRFVGYLISQASGNYIDSYGYTYSRSSSAYKHLLQGNYEITGGVIRFSNCQISTTMEFDKYPTRADGSYDAMSDLMTAPLNSPSKEDDFVAEFEFIDSQRLRLKLNRNVLENYDIDFKWEGGARSIDLPAHRIPPAVWPANSLSTDMPLYGDGGRLRTVSHFESDDNTTAESRTTTLTIDRTTLEAILGYASRLRQAGWSGPSDQDILNKKKDAEDSISSIITKLYTFDYYKGVYRLYFAVDAEDSFRITSSREEEGYWPSDFWGDAFKPPEGSVYIGATDLENVLDLSGNIYMSFKIDFYPGTPDGYVEGLLQKGFVVYETIYSNPEISAFMRIDGEVFKVLLERGYDNIGTIATMNYRLVHYPGFDWPSDMPPGVPPPDGFDLLREKDKPASPAASWDSSSYSFSFVTIGMSDAEVQAYFNSLLNSGWQVSIVPSGAYFKIIPWNGNNWICHISGGNTYANATTFEVTFRIH